MQFSCCLATVDDDYAAVPFSKRRLPFKQDGNVIAVVFIILHLKLSRIISLIIFRRDLENAVG